MLLLLCFCACLHPSAQGKTKPVEVPVASARAPAGVVVTPVV